MEYDKLLKLKSEVDELNIYYRALKNREEELKEVLFANNMLDNVSNKKEVDTKEINTYIANNRYKNMFRWVGIYFIAILVLNACKDQILTEGMCNFLRICATCIYVHNILFYEEKARKKYKKKHQSTSIDLEEIKSEYNSLEMKIEETKKQFYEKSLEYDKLVGSLNEDDYYNYLEYLNNYLYDMLENSQDKLSEAELLAFNASDDEKSYRLLDR